VALLSATVKRLAQPFNYTSSMCSALSSRVSLTDKTEISDCILTPVAMDEPDHDANVGLQSHCKNMCHWRFIYSAKV